MNIRQDIRPVTYFKTQAAAVLNQINATRRPVIITQDGEPRAVLQDPESYERMVRAIALMKLIGQGEADLRKGRVVGHGSLFSALSKKLAKKRDARA